MDLTAAAEPLEGFARFLVSLVLDRNRGDQLGREVLYVNRVLVSTHAGFLASLGRNQVVRRDYLAPFLGLTFIGSLKMLLLNHLTTTTILTIWVERFMPQ